VIKVDVKFPSAADLKRAAFAEIEKQIASKARSAAARHGGVTVRFTRKADGTLRTLDFQGSDAAIAAARRAIER
jgi:type IV secretory pathway TrbL component